MRVGGGDAEQVSPTPQIKNTPSGVFFIFEICFGNLEMIIDFHLQIIYTNL